MVEQRAPFQIRDFPVSLREEIVRAAKDAEMTVSDFATGVFVQAREAGWVRAVPTRGSAANGLSNTQDTEIAQNISLLVEAACRLASTKGVNQAFRKSANRTLAQRVAAYGAALPAPAPETEQSAPAEENN